MVITISIVFLWWTNKTFPWQMKILKYLQFNSITKFEGKTNFYLLLSLSKTIHLIQHLPKFWNIKIFPHKSFQSSLYGAVAQDTELDFIFQLFFFNIKLEIKIKSITFKYTFVSDLYIFLIDKHDILYYNNQSKKNI